MEGYRYIDKVGVELEGLWKDPDDNIRARIRSDGSVCNFNVRGVIGEIPTSPYSDFPNLAHGVREMYPDVVNATCGMHVHVSLTNGGAYSTLIDERFRDYFYRVLARWGRLHGLVPGHRFWKRLNGEVHYCDTKLWLPDRQLADTHKGDARYAGINFCYALHKTVEFRVLPMFHKVNTSLAAIRTVLRATDRYLSLPSSNKPEKVVIETALDIDEDVETREITYYAQQVA